MSKQVKGWRRFQRFRGLIGLSALLGTLMAGAPAAFAVENWFEQGLADLKNKHYQAAVEKFTLAIEAVPDDFEALNNRGFARIYTGDYDGAIADCSRSIAINPDSAKAYNNRGFARLFTGDYTTAIDDFSQAIAINPRYVDAYSNRGLARVHKGDYTQAIADCTEALHLNPRSAKALYNRGFARDRQGDPGRAMQDYIQALKINPAFTEVFNNMAWILATCPDERLRDGRRAVAYAETAVGTMPDINFLDTLAAAYAEAGRFDEAVAVENRIISLLASTRQADSIAAHVRRLNHYEEGRPYREPLAVQPVSAVTDLRSELASLDRLIFAPEVSVVAYEPAESARNLTADAGPQTGSGGRDLHAQADPEISLTAPEAYSQSLQTSPGVPLEISLAAEPEGFPLTFEIETVPYQGALQGTLPNLLYIPRPGFAGVDRFTFRARNAMGLSNLATVTIVVAEPPDQAPTQEPPAASEETIEATPVEEMPPSPPATAPTDADYSPEPAAPPTAPAEEMREPPAATPEAAGLEGADAPSIHEDAETPEPATEPGLATGARYTIQVRSVKEAAGAAAIVDRLIKDGYEAFALTVEVPGKGQWQRVFIGGYPSMPAARAALDKLDPERFKDAFIRRMPGVAGVAGDAPAPEPALPAAAPEPEISVPAGGPTPEPALPADAPSTAPELPAAAPAPEPKVPAPSVEPSEPPTDQPLSDPVSHGEGEGLAIPVGEAAYPYAYQVKSFKQREDAFQLAMELTAQGHTAFIGRATLGTTGVWYRVFVGSYPTVAEAEKRRTDLIREGFPEAFLAPVTFTIRVIPDETDPAAESLENRLMASGFLPYRLPRKNEGGPPTILVGGFRHPEDAEPVLAALAQSGFKGEIKPR